MRVNTIAVIGVCVSIACFTVYGVPLETHALVSARDGSLSVDLDFDDDQNEERGNRGREKNSDANQDREEEEELEIQATTTVATTTAATTTATTTEEVAEETATTTLLASRNIGDTISRTVSALFGHNQETLSAHNYNQFGFSKQITRILLGGAAGLGIIGASMLFGFRNIVQELYALVLGTREKLTSPHITYED
jgi:hypothetical protein